MFIQIHIIQNHSPANLNRDDLGAPKTCYFGGHLRLRISSQCIKRSIRTSKEFEKLLGGVRTRRLAELISQQVNGSADIKKRASKILKKCGIDIQEETDESKTLVYTTKEAISEMARLLQNDAGVDEESLARQFTTLFLERVYVPDMALCGRMLEVGSGLLQNTKTEVEAALQVSHAISTHIANPEVDYYVAADDVPGTDAGAGFLGEAMFASACFYKYFSINWEQLVKNLKGNEKLAAHTVGAFLRAAALTNPTGKQNSYAAHNPPDGILIEINDIPISYANAFVVPATKETRDIISQSIAQLAHYVRDIEQGYGQPEKRFWFSPNRRYPLGDGDNPPEVAADWVGNLNELVERLIGHLGFDWKEVQQVVSHYRAIQ